MPLVNGVRLLTPLAEPEQRHQALSRFQRLNRHIAAAFVVGLVDEALLLFHSRM